MSLQDGSHQEPVSEGQAQDTGFSPQQGYPRDAAASEAATGGAAASIAPLAAAAASGHSGGVQGQVRAQDGVALTMHAFKVAWSSGICWLGHMSGAEVLRCCTESCTDLCPGPIFNTSQTDRASDVSSPAQVICTLLLFFNKLLSTYACCCFAEWLTPRSSCIRGANSALRLQSKGRLPKGCRCKRGSNWWWSCSHSSFGGSCCFRTF